MQTLDTLMQRWCRTLPGSRYGVWCTHGDLPCVQLKTQCLAAGWQWWPQWGRATPETPESSEGRPAPHLCDETHGSNRCRGEDRLSFDICQIRHVDSYPECRITSDVLIIKIKWRQWKMMKIFLLLDRKTGLKKHIDGIYFWILQHSLRESLPAILSVWTDVVPLSLMWISYPTIRLGY